MQKLLKNLGFIFVYVALHFISVEVLKGDEFQPPTLTTEEIRNLIVNYSSVNITDDYVGIEICNPYTSTVGYSDCVNIDYNYFDYSPITGSFTYYFED